MSAPTARRGDNIMALLQKMIDSKRGWGKQEIFDFLFIRYRGGVREETLTSIFNQLKDCHIIVPRPVKKGSNLYLWWVDTEKLEQLKGALLA